MKIYVNGEERELVAIRANGIEYTEDLIGNDENSMVQYDEELGQYITDEETYKWWNEVIGRMNGITERISKTLNNQITFISEEHEKFYYEKLKKVRIKDVYHKALCYCLGISDITRRNIDKIYNFETGWIKTECLQEGWQTSGTLKVVRMAFNLYSGGIPSISDDGDIDEQINECKCYAVDDLFCCAYAPFFWQAVQIRYPEYAEYNYSLHAVLGSLD